MTCSVKSTSATGFLFCMASMAFWVCSSEPKEAPAAGEVGGEDAEAGPVDMVLREARRSETAQGEAQRLTESIGSGRGESPL
jgi:hypothetical protein